MEGEGNLSFLNVPIPNWGDLVQTEMIESTSIEPGTGGYTGQRRVEYRFISDSDGEFTIVVPDFVYFDAKNEAVRTAHGSSFRVAFDPPATEITESVSMFPFTVPSYEEFLVARTWGAYQIPRIYLWLLPAPLAFLVLLIYLCP